MLSRVVARPGSTACKLVTQVREIPVLRLVGRFLSQESWSASKSLAVVEVGRCSLSHLWVIGLSELFLWIQTVNTGVDLFLQDCIFCWFS